MLVLIAYKPLWISLPAHRACIDRCSTEIPLCWCMTATQPILQQLKEKISAMQQVNTAGSTNSSSLCYSWIQHSQWPMAENRCFTHAAAGWQHIIPLGKCKLNHRQAAGNCRQPGCPAPCTCRTCENQGWGYRIKTSPAWARKHCHPHGKPALHISVSSVWTCKHYPIPEETSLMFKFLSHTLSEMVFIMHVWVLMLSILK